MAEQCGRKVIGAHNVIGGVGEDGARRLLSTAEEPNAPLDDLHVTTAKLAVGQVDGNLLLITAATNTTANTLSVAIWPQRQRKLLPLKCTRKGLREDGQLSGSVDSEQMAEVFNLPPVSEGSQLREDVKRGHFTFRAFKIFCNHKLIGIWFCLRADKDELLVRIGNL